MPEAPPFEPRSPFETAFRAAIEGADAYRAVRAGLRLHEEILRIGNRFVPVARFREIAFVALGNAAGSMGLAAQEMLGERLTQGLVAGAVPPPPALQFQHVRVPDAWPGSSAADTARSNLLELATGLGSDDLLLLLLSPGALSVTAGPPVGWDGAGWRRLLTDVDARSGALSAARVARGLGTGATGGRLASAVRAPLVVTLVVDRGEGPESVGGGPTIPLSDTERSAVAPLVAGSDAAGLTPTAVPASGPNVHRPVVVTGPADAIEAAGNLLAGQGWISRLVGVHIPGGPEEVAARFVEGMETIRNDQVSEPRSVRSGPDAALESTVPSIPVPTTDTPSARPESRGLAVFATATFDTVEGGERGEEVRSFLETASRRTVRREAYVGALRTAGGIPDRGGAAGGWMARRVGSGTPTESFEVRAGFTDVGTLLVGFVPWAAR